MDSLPIHDARPGDIEALVYVGGRGPTKEWAPQIPTSLWNGGLPVHSLISTAVLLFVVVVALITG
jgi:hypothetical protein